MNVRAVVRASLRLLTPHDRRLLVFSVLAQMATAVLDLLGVVLIGAVGALSISAVQAQKPPQLFASITSALGLSSLSQTAVIATLAAAAAGLLLLKSVVSPLLIARILRFLGRREVAISARLTKELLSRPLTFLQRRSTQETAAALIQSANAATMVVLGQAMIAAAEITLLILTAATLLIVNPVLALGVILFFGLMGFGLQWLLGQRAARAGVERANADIASLRAAQEALGSYREITVLDRRSFYVDRIGRLRETAARAAAAQQTIGILPKYVSEAALVLGGFALAAVLFSTQPISAAAGTLALFLAAATRLMPSLLRLQSAALTIRAAAGSAARTFALAEDLGFPAALNDNTGNKLAWTALGDGGNLDFVPAITLHEVSFTYPGADRPAVHDIDLSVGVGQSVAFVGRSGGGKSTLADLILGVLEPVKGTVLVSGIPPAEAIRRWPGAIAYVPQDVMLANDSVRNNVALGVPPELIDDDQVWEALRRAHLADFIERQTNGLDTHVGERGLRFSGGQRQRLGLARALFTSPRLIVLDEATSALDAETERAITATIDGLDDDVTTVIIAHRLSTVRNVDVVSYLEDGAEVAIGTFREVCDQVPALQRQADLMGLRNV